MAMFENFPYTDMHNLNLDWIIKIAKDFLEQYTHIQQLITEGENSLQTLTNEGIEELQNKADNLETLLQEWYNTHSSDIANQLANALSDLNDWYTLHQNYLDETLQTKITAFDTHADQKAAETIATIPADYTELANDVAGIHQTLKKEAILAEENEYIYTGLIFTAGKAVSRATGIIGTAASENYGATEDYIEIPIGTLKIESNIISWSASAYGVAFYDENKTFIEGFATIYAQPVKGNYKYVRVTHNISYGTPFADVYIKMTGINLVVNNKLDADVFNRFIDTGVTWSHGYMGSNGVYVENASYSMSSFIPAGLITSIRVRDGLTLNVNFFDQDKTH